MYCPITINQSFQAQGCVMNLESKLFTAAYKQKLDQQGMKPSRVQTLLLLLLKNNVKKNFGQLNMLPLLK